MRSNFLIKCKSIALLAILISCASKPQSEMISLIKGNASIWTGLWQGFILPFSLLGKILNLNIGIHEISYSGASYWIGFLIGFILFVRLVLFLETHKVKS